MKSFVDWVWNRLVHIFKLIISPSYRAAENARLMIEALEKRLQNQSFKTLYPEDHLDSYDRFLLVLAASKRARKRARNLRLLRVR